VGWNNIFAGTGRMEWEFCGYGWVWKRNCPGTGGDGYEIGGERYNFCPRAGV